MMSAELEELGRRAVACKHWRWMPGMLLDRNERLVGIDEEGCPYGHSLHRGERRVWLGEGSHPNLSDPATLGCLLALVREAWRTSSLHTRLNVDRWEVRDTYCTVVYDKPAAIVCGLDWVGAGGKSDPNGPHTSEIEALVAALEGAP